MPIPSFIADLNQTAANNSPLGTESPATIDDYMRAHASFIAMLRDGKVAGAEVSVASAATCDIGAADSPFVRITGTTGITSFGTNYNGPRFLRFADVVTLTHNATTLALPGGVDLTTQAGDTCVAFPIGTPAAGWTIQGLARSQINNVMALYGLGTVASVTIADLDDATVPSGMYQVTGSTIGTNPVGAGTAGQVFHNISGTSGAQVYISNTRTFTRRRSASVWQTWQESALLSGAAFTGAVSVAGTATLSGAAITAAVGPTAARQHTLPNVPSDTIALVGQGNSFTARQALGAGYNAAAINYDYQPAPGTAYTAGDTIAAADLLTRLIRFTGAAGTITMPTGVNIDNATSLADTNRGFDFSVINTGSGTCTVATSVGLSNIGALTVSSGDSGLFRLRRTAANTYVLYRAA